MVPIENSNAEYILKDMVVSLLTKLKTVDPQNIDGAFASWIYPKEKEAIMAEQPLDLAMSNYMHVAQLGYLMDIDPKKYYSKLEELEDGLNRTSMRPSIVMGSPAAFCNDAVALLGIAIGAKRIGGGTMEAVFLWMKSFPVVNANLPNWKRILIGAAFGLLDNSKKTSLDFINNEIADVQLALISRGLAFLPDVDFNQAYRAICNGLIYQEDEFPVISARLQSIDYLINHLPAISLSNPNINQLIKLLNNITHAFRRWSWEEKAKTSTGTPQRWDLQNEYHVQNMLYFLLAPIFPDIESEFYFENIGQLNPRADIGLPSLNLIIEVKFLRKTKNFQDMLEEIAADNTLYFKSKGIFKEKYSQMLVFLWDDTNRDQEHGTFRNGVNSFHNIVDSVVISRPGLMSNSQPTAKPRSHRKKISKN